MSRKQSWNTILVFCILIFGLTAATLIAPKRQFSETENRSLAQMPQVTAKSVFSGEFESNYEDYLTDQFVLRDEWIGLKTDVERAMQKRESKDIYFADDDYLIEKHTGSFTSERAEQNKNLLVQFVDRYQETFGTDHMTAMVVPNAVDILADKLPPYASPYDEELYLAELEQAVPQEVWFDVASVLRKHSGEELYYHTDHHWKTAAAFYVYQEWADAQGFRVPSIDEYTVETATDQFEGTIQSKLGIHTVYDTIELYHPKEDIFYTVRENNAEEVSYSLYDYTALDTKDKYAVFFGGNQAQITISTRANTGKKLLLIKDSYAHCFVPFLLGEFDEIDMLDIRYYNQKLSDLIAQGGYTDLLFLYNASGFAEDTSLLKLMG